MGTHINAKSKRQQAHTSPRSKVHKLDRELGKLRRQAEWSAYEAPTYPSPTRDFGNLQSQEFKYRDGELIPCDDPEDYANYAMSEAVKHSWYKKETVRKGVPVMMKRTAGTPVEIVTTTAEPALSDFIAAQVSAGRDPSSIVDKIQFRWLFRVLPRVSSNRKMLGMSRHADTDDLHWDLLLSRQDGIGGRVGETALRLTGPWATATDRQVRCGAKISSDKKQKLAMSVANFRARYGANEVPFDVFLARSLDDATTEVLGNLITPYREAYARRVPDLERAHTKAKLDALERAHKRVLGASGPTHDVGPDLSLGR